MDRERARDTMRSGALRSALTAQDALPSKSAEADFRRRFPGEACQRTVPTATAGNRYETRPRHSIRTDCSPAREALAAAIAARDAEAARLQEAQAAVTRMGELVAAAEQRLMEANQQGRAARGQARRSHRGCGQEWNAVAGQWGNAPRHRGRTGHPAIILTLCRRQQ